MLLALTTFITFSKAWPVLLMKDESFAATSVIAFGKVLPSPQKPLATIKQPRR